MTEPTPFLRREAKTLNSALGLRIRRRRKARGLTQEKLAIAIGVSFQQIQKYERGSSQISVLRLITIAHALDCRLVDLLDNLDGGTSQGPLPPHAAPGLAVSEAQELLAAYSDIPEDIRGAFLNVAMQIAGARGSAVTAARPQVS